MPSLRFSEVHETSLYSRFSAAPSGGSFAFVMATGIVAIAAQSQGLRPIGIALFALNSAAFAILLLLMALRVIRNRSAVVTELSQHRTAAGFLTIVAGTAVLGDEVAVQLGARPVAAALWLAACGFWVGFDYAFFVALATRANKSSLAQGLDGTWLLVAVATESLAVLATHVTGGFARPDIVVWLGLSWFLLGGFFYLIVIVLVLQRWLFEPLLPDELTPPYWINMGAMAIATLAGAQLESIAGMDPLLTRLLPGLALATMLCWAVATWWIPLILLMMIWRHAVRGVPLSYRFSYWSMVFPLGMYTAATSAFVRAEGLDFLGWIPRVFVWIALGAWGAVCSGMIRNAIRAPIKREPHRPAG